MTVTEKLGSKIRAARESAGMTQEELALKAGLRQPNVSQYESGTHVPTIDVLRRLRAAMGCQWEALLGGL